MRVYSFQRHLNLVPLRAAQNSDVCIGGRFPHAIVQLQIQKTRFSVESHETLCAPSLQSVPFSQEHPMQCLMNVSICGLEGKVFANPNKKNHRGPTFKAHSLLLFVGSMKDEVPRDHKACCSGSSPCAAFFSHSISNPGEWELICVIESDPCLRSCSEAGDLHNSGTTPTHDHVVHTGVMFMNVKNFQASNMRFSIFRSRIFWCCAHKKTKMRFACKMNQAWTQSHMEHRTTDSSLHS